MIPLGTVASSRVIIPSIDIFMWSDGNNYLPTDGGGASFSDNILLTSGQTYAISFTSGLNGYTKLKNQTTNTELVTTNGWATNTVNGTIVANNQDSPKIDFYTTGTVVGQDMNNPGYFITLSSDLEVDSGGSGAGSSCYNGSIIQGEYSGGVGYPEARILAGLGGDGVDNPYAAIFGPTYVCAGGAGTFSGNDYVSNEVLLYPGPLFATCLRPISGSNLAASQSYTGSGATVLNNAQIGTNAGKGAAIVKSTVPLTFGSASHATNGGFHYYFITANTTFQMS